MVSDYELLHKVHLRGLLVNCEYMGNWDEWKPVYDELPAVTRAALAHLHGRHAELTMYCPLCGFGLVPVGGDSR